MVEFLNSKVYTSVVDPDAELVRPWMGVGTPPPQDGGFGQLCDQCGESSWIELGGGGAVDSYRPSIDIRRLPGVDIVQDLSQGIPFHDGHATRIKTIHVLNHMPYVAAQFMLRECYRVLRPLGTLFIMVTDMGFILERILVDGPRDAWMTSLYGTRGDTHKDDFHYWGYTVPSLHEELTKVGFSQIEHLGHFNAWELKMIATK